MAAAENPASSAISRKDPLCMPRAPKTFSAASRMSIRFWRLWAWRWARRWARRSGWVAMSSSALARGGSSLTMAPLVMRGLSR